MIWLSIVSLLAGALLAHRFKFIVLVPATAVVVLVACGAGLAQTKGFVLLTIAVASAGVQIGYFVGMMIQHGLFTLLVRRSSSFASTTSAQDPARYRP